MDGGENREGRFRHVRMWCGHMCETLENLKSTLLAAGFRPDRKGKGRTSLKILFFSLID